MTEVFRFQEPEIALEDERPNPGAPNAQGLTDAASLNNPAKLEQSAAFLQRCVAISERGGGNASLVTLPTHPHSN